MMATVADKMPFLAEQAIVHPFRTANIAIVACLAVSVVIGIFWGSDQFEKAGILSVLVGAITFGVTVEQISIKALAAVWLDETGQRKAPFDNANVARVFKAETFLVVFGALQSTYGKMLWEAVVKYAHS